MQSPGELRPSQIVSTFGPGAVVDLREQSALVYDLAEWKIGPVVHEPRLEKYLKVNRFLSPPSGHAEGDVPIASFPAYAVCGNPDCARMTTKPFEGRCPKCNYAVHPARLITACARGHLDDFPWVLWCHKGRAVCDSPALVLRARGRTSTLADMEVKCIAKGCGASQTLNGALQANALRGIIPSCSARRPWLRTDDTRCDQTPRALQRGASNVYFSCHASALSVPKWSGDLVNMVSELWPVFGPMFEMPHVPLQQLRAMVENHPMAADAVRRYGIERLMAEMERRRTLTVESHDGILREEYEAFLGDLNSDEFKTRRAGIPAGLQGKLADVILVDRLREVRALRGFTRISPPDPEERDQSLAQIASRNIGWLPALEIRGEGLFFTLDDSSIKEWEERPDVQRRCGVLFEEYHRQRELRGWPPKETPLPRYVLLHTIAHLIIRELSLVCGYSSASLRERIYSGPGMAGFLIYTGSQDSDGSLGGLVLQGSAGRLDLLMHQTLISAKSCSSDPLCREHSPGLGGNLKGAACHACALAPETACEAFNQMLDRALVSDIPGVEGLGFFS